MKIRQRPRRKHGCRPRACAIAAYTTHARTHIVRQSAEHADDATSSQLANGGAMHRAGKPRFANETPTIRTYIGVFDKPPGQNSGRGNRFGEFVDTAPRSAGRRNVAKFERRDEEVVMHKCRTTTVEKSFLTYGERSKRGARQTRTRVGTENGQARNTASTTCWRGAPRRQSGGVGAARVEGKREMPTVRLVVR